jgi:transposase
MGQPVEITRLEHSASELRAFAAKIKDAAIARRLLALALVLEGHSRELAATMNGMTRQTLGPDPERHRVVRWRRIDLCEEVARRWSVRVCEQTVGRWLRQLRMTRLQPRPVHPKKDPAAEIAFKKTSLNW